MADDPNEKWADINPLVSGAEAASKPAPPEPRSWPRAFVDTGLDIAAGGVGALRSVYGATDAVAAIDTKSPQAQRSRQNMDTLADLETVIKGARSEDRQNVDRTGGYSFHKDPGKYMLGAATGMLPYAPLAAMGPYGAVAGAAMGYGQVRSDTRERVRNAPIEEMRKNPQYVDLVDQGLSDADARERIAVDATDPTKWENAKAALPNTVGMAATSGLGGALVKGFSMPMMRNVGAGIVQRAMDATNKNFLTRKATGVGMATGSGAAMGGGAELSRQMSEQNAGIKRDDLDWGTVGEGMQEMATLFGPLGLLHKGTPRKAAAPPVNTHVEAVAGPWGRRDGTDVTAPDATSPDATAAGPWGPRGEPEDILPPPYDPATPSGPPPPRRGPPRPGARPPIMTGGPEPDEKFGTSIPYDVPPPPPQRPRNISNDAVLVGLADDGRQIWQGRNGLRQFADESNYGIRVTEPKRNSGDERFMTADERAARPSEYGAASEPAPATEQGPGHRVDDTGADLYPKERYDDQPAPFATDTPVQRVSQDAVPAGQRRMRQPEEFAVSVGEPPGPPKPHNIEDGAKYIGDTYDGRQIWQGPSDRRQYVDETKPGAPRVTEGARERGKPRDSRFVAEHEKPEAERYDPNTAQGEIAQLRNIASKWDANTAMSMARVLEKAWSEGKGISALREQGRAMFQHLRGKMDALLHHHPDEVLDAIRGDVVPLHDGISAEGHDAIDVLRRAAGDKAAEWADAIDKLFGKPGGAKLRWLLLPKEMRAAAERSKELQSHVSKALQANPHAVAERLRNENPTGEPTGYARPGDVGKRVEPGEAAASPEGEVLTKAGEPIPEVSFGEQGEGVTEIPVDEHEGQLGYVGGVPEIVPRAGAIGATHGDLGLTPEGKYQKGLKYRMHAQEGRTMTATPVIVSTQFRGKVTERTEPRTTTTNLAEAFKLGEAKRVARRKELGEKVKMHLADRGTGERPLFHITEKGKIGDRTEAQRERVRTGGTSLRPDEATQRTEALVAKRMKEREKQAFKEHMAERRDERERTTLFDNLAHYQRWEDAVLRAFPVDLPEFWRNYDAQQAIADKDINRLQKAAARMRNSDSKEARRASEYRIRNIIARAFVQSKLVTEAHLNKVLSGIRLVVEKGKATETYLTDDAMRRGERWASDDEGNSWFKPFIKLPLHELKKIANEFAAMAQARIDAAEQKFKSASKQQYEKDNRHWSIGLTVGTQRRRGEHFYNQLVDDRVFIAAVKRFGGGARPGKLKYEGGNKQMLQQLVLNHWISQKLALEGRTRKMRDFYQERTDLLRQEMEDKFDTMGGEDAEKAMVAADIKKAMEIIDEHGEQVDEAEGEQAPLTQPLLDLYQRLDEAGLGKLIPGGSMAAFALRAANHFLSRDIREQYERRDVALRRILEAESAKDAAAQRVVAYDKKMEELYGKDWRDIDRDTLDTMEGRRAMVAEYGDERVVVLDPNAKAAREALPADLAEGLDEQIAFLTDGKPLSPEGIKYRIAKLTERANQIIDRIETVPEAERDPKLVNELSMLQDEIRQHYEAAVPGARNKEFSIGRVLDDGSDLSNPDNLPKGAYVRRVSDFLKEGVRDIRSGIGDMPGRLRNHLLSIAHRVVGDMEIVALTSEQMDMAAREVGLAGTTPAFFDPASHRIFIRQDVLSGPNRNRILGHEITHPLTLRAMEMFPSVKKRLTEQWQELRTAFYQQRHPAHGEVRKALDGNRQALDNVHEMIGELYNDGGNVAAALHAIETTPEQRALWKSPGLWDGFAVVRDAIKKGLSGLLFRNSRKRLLNDVTLNSLDLFHSMEERGYSRPARNKKAMAYTPKEEMSKGEREIWARYPAKKIDDVLSLEEGHGRRGQMAASYAIAEDGQIHDVGLHEKHVERIAAERGIDQESYFFGGDDPKARPYVHISKFMDTFDPSISLGVDYSPGGITPAQRAAIRQLVTEARKAARTGDPIHLTVNYENIRLAGGEFAGGKTRASLPAGVMDAWEAGPKADYTMRGGGAVKDYLKFFDQSPYPPHKFLGESLRAFQHLVGDVEIRVVDTPDWRGWVKSVGGPPGALGVFFDQKKPYVAVPKNYEMYAVVHELAHAATARALAEHPEFSAAITKIAYRLQADPAFARWKAEMGYGKNDGIYGFINAKEFAAEFYGNWRLRELMKRVQLSPAEAKAFGGLLRKRNLFQVALDTIAKFLRKSLGSKDTISAETMTADLLRGVLERQGHLRNYGDLKFAGAEAADKPLTLTPYQKRTGGGSFLAGHARTPRSVDEATGTASELWKDAAFRLKRMGLSGAVLKASTFVDLRRRAEAGMQTVMKGVEDVWSKIETTARKYFTDSGAEDISRAIAAEMRMPAAVFQKLQDYVSLENHYRVSGSDPLYEGKNSWVSRDSPYHQHYRDRHAELRNLWLNELTDAQRSVRTRALDFYEKQYGKILNNNLRMVIGLKGMVPDSDPAKVNALIKHVMREDLTDADKRVLDTIPGYDGDVEPGARTEANDKFKAAVSDMRSSPLFKKIQGVWYPSERRGQHVVAGRYDLSVPARRHGGRKVDENGHEWEFDTDAQAQAFYRDVTTSDAYGGIHHEGTTEHVYEADEHGRIRLDAEGKPVPATYFTERTSRRGTRMDESTADEDRTPFVETTVGARHRVSAAEAAREGGEGTVTRHRVEFNPVLLEFYEKEREAFERHEELVNNDQSLIMAHPQPVRDTKGTYLDPKKASRTMAVLMDSLERGEAWGDMTDAQRRMASRDLNEAAARHIMSTSARSQRIPRRYALGADKSFLRDFNDYARNTSMSLAEAHHRPALSSSLKSMDDYVRANDRWVDTGGDQNKYGTLRRKLQAEIHNRVFTRPSDIVAPFWTKALARVLQLSYMDKLMSPGFIVLNATEPWVLGAPILTGFHGFKAYGEIGRAYASLGFGGLWGKGIGNAVRAAHEGVGAKFEDNHVLLTDRIRGEPDAADLQRMFEHGRQRGYFDRDAGMELAQRIDPSTGRIGRGMDHLDNVTRQINAQIENVNRGVIAIAAYRMARRSVAEGGKGWSHEKSMDHAFEVVHDVSGNYGHWNTPSIYNDPRFKFALQFKRYSQRITANYVRMFANAFSKMPSDERAVARKQLMVMMGSQIFFSGALGLPTEPIKAALLATSPITGFGPEEAQIAAREAMASLTGNPQLAEALMMGVPRAYADIGIGTRLSHDSLWSHGTLGKKPDSWFATAGHYLIGAPGSMLADFAVAGKKGADAMGNFARGYYTQAGADAVEMMQLGLPIKLGADIIGSASTYMGGPKTMTPSGLPLGYQPTVPQAFLEASGIRSGTAQEASDKRFALTQAKAQYAEQKTTAFQRYVRAGSPAQARSIKEDAIRNSQQQWPRGMWLTEGDFVKAKRRFELHQSVDPGDVGVVLGPKQSGLRERFNFYNN